MKISIKKNIMQAVAIFTTVVMLCSIVKLPVTYAYFTAGAESEVLTFTIVKADGITGCDVSFIDKFLIAENEESGSEAETGGEMMLMGFAAGSSGNLPLSSSPGPSPRLTSSSSPSLGLNPSFSLNAADLSTASLYALFGEDRQNIEEMLSGENRVQAEIRLPEDGFDPGEIYVPSIELHYNESSAPALSGELNADDALIVDFDRSQIAAWFEGTGEEMEQVTFSVTGEGYVGGLDRFLFEGEVTLKLKGSYATQETAITGSDAFFIPEPGEKIEGTYLLENQDGVLLEGARWALDTSVASKGVEIDRETGALTIYANAAPGPVAILTAIELEGRILAAQKTIELYAKPASVISGADTITVPLPGETALEQYTVEPPAELTLTNVTWELPEETNGICADETGLVSVTNDTADTAAESFTLAACLEFAGVGNPLLQEKEILLHTIRIGAVEVTGTETMLIPDGEQLLQYYRALVLDAEGTVLESEPVSWSLENGGGSGVSLDAEGILTVEPHAPSGNITVLATSVRDPGISGSLTVTLEAPAWEEEKIGSTPPAGEGHLEECLNIEGETLVLIPAGEEALTFTYTALDNNRQPLLNVLFQLRQEHEGVSLTENGVLTVDSSAAEGEIVLLASLRGDAEEEEEEVSDAATAEEGAEGATVTQKGSLTGELIVTLSFPAPSVEEPPVEEAEDPAGPSDGGDAGGEDPPGKEEDPPELEEPPAEGDDNDDNGLGDKDGTDLEGSGTDDGDTNGDGTGDGDTAGGVSDAGIAGEIGVIDEDDDDDDEIGSGENGDDGDVNGNGDDPVAAIGKADDDEEDNHDHEDASFNEL